MTTPEQHNKYLAYAHLAYGTLTALFTLAFLVMFGSMFVFIANAPAENNPPPAGFFIFFMLIFGGFYAALTIPSFVAGYALLKRKSWARIASIIAGVVAAAFFPIGTAICVYTLWFLLSEPGKILYDTPAQPRPQPSLFGVNQEPIEQREFHRDSSATPPDWR